MDYFLAIVVSGLLSGAIYALMGIALVVIYRSSGVLNLSLGEWAMLGARLTGSSAQLFGLPLMGAIATALVALSLLAVAFNRLVIRHLIARPVVSVV
ncbi:MAG: branched-chain amino acid ABC transporter permease, partial [Gammaproteobacteria bacterium]|nr:branched-chain amino acid ABC transporter permease [Gammaproteobacteria bacterium]